MAVMRRTVNRPVWPLIVLLAVGIGLIMPLLPHPGDTKSFEHAVEKHGLDAARALNCRPEDFILTFHNPVTQRIGYVCRQDGKWFIVIVSAITGWVVTAFCKEKLKRQEQVEQYMKNAGYDKWPRAQ